MSLSNQNVLKIKTSFWSSTFATFSATIIHDIEDASRMIFEGNNISVNIFCLKRRPF